MSEPQQSSLPEQSEANAISTDWVTLPNIITLSRLLLAFVLFALIAADYAAIPSAIVFVIAVMTDALDGYIARRYNLISVVGRILDPFVDKIIIIGTFLFLLEKPASGVTAWMVLSIVSREMLVTLIRSFLEQKGRDFSANWLGKLKMVLQCVALTLSILSLSSQFSQPQFLLLRNILLWIAVGITIWSGVTYVWRALQIVTSRP